MLLSDSCTIDRTSPPISRRIASRTRLASASWERLSSATRSSSVETTCWSERIGGDGIPDILRRCGLAEAISDRVGLDNRLRIIRRDGVYKRTADSLDLLHERVARPPWVSLGPSAIRVASVSAVC